MNELTIPMAVQAVEQAYLEKGRGNKPLTHGVLRIHPRPGGSGHQVR